MILPESVPLPLRVIVSNWDKISQGTDATTPDSVGGKHVSWSHTGGQ